MVGPWRMMVQLLLQWAVVLRSRRLRCHHAVPQPGTVMVVMMVVTVVLPLLMVL